MSWQPRQMETRGLGRNITPIAMTRAKFITDLKISFKFHRRKWPFFEIKLKLLPWKNSPRYRLLESHSAGSTGADQRQNVLIVRLRGSNQNLALFQ